MQTLFMPKVVHVQNENQQLQLISEPMFCAQEAAMCLLSTTNAWGKGFYGEVMHFSQCCQNLEVVKCLGFLLHAFVQAGRRVLCLARSAGWDSEGPGSI